MSTDRLPLLSTLSLCPTRTTWFSMPALLHFINLPWGSLFRPLSLCFFILIISTGLCNIVHLECLARSKHVGNMSPPSASILFCKKSKQFYYIDSLLFSNLKPLQLKMWDYEDSYSSLWAFSGFCLCQTLAYMILILAYMFYGRYTTLGTNARIWIQVPDLSPNPDFSIFSTKIGIPMDMAIVTIIDCY